jgi:uncharacterized protein
MAARKSRAGAGAAGGVTRHPDPGAGGTSPPGAGEPAKPHPVPVSFPGPAGVLVGLWADPGTGLPPAVICHPHPAHGGTMHSKVVHTVHRVLGGSGHPTLRFNFRGAGLSEGRFSGGEGEVEDVAAAAAFARGRAGGPRLWGAGFSFGAWAGLRWALRDREVERFIALGLPVDAFPFDVLTEAPVPLLIVQGDHDRYGSVASVDALAGRLRASRPVEVRVVASSDHFFTGRLSALAGALRDGLGLSAPSGARRNGRTAGPARGEVS